MQTGRWYNIKNLKKKLSNFDKLKKRNVFNNLNISWISIPIHHYNCCKKPYKCHMNYTYTHVDCKYI